MSGVLVVLGAAVAKTAFKVWTGDNALADNVTDELTDLLAGRVNDARDRQKVANRFASIAEIVGDRVAVTLRMSSATSTRASRTRPCSRSRTRCGGPS